MKEHTILLVIVLAWGQTLARIEPSSLKFEMKICRASTVLFVEMHGLGQ